MIQQILSNLSKCVFGNGNRCYFCQRRLKVSVINLIEEWFPFEYPATQPVESFRCSKGHVEYGYGVKNGKLLFVRYMFGKYVITCNYHNLFGGPVYGKSFQVQWQNNGYWHQLNIPEFDIERLTTEQVLNKIKLYLLFS